jgi:hypothetical protein
MRVSPWKAPRRGQYHHCLPCDAKGCVADVTIALMTEIAELRRSTRVSIGVLHRVTCARARASGSVLHRDLIRDTEDRTYETEGNSKIRRALIRNVHLLAFSSTLRDGSLYPVATR